MLGRNSCWDYVGTGSKTGTLTVLVEGRGQGAGGRERAGEG